MPRPTATRVDSVIQYERRTSASAGRYGQDQELEKVGALPLRTSMGYRSRGLFRGRRSVVLFSSRTCAEPGLPLGRRWAAGDHGPRMPALLRPGALEWPRPNPERTSVRANWPGRKPWGGRQGVLFLSRFVADPLLPQSALQVPAGGLSLRSTGPRESWAESESRRI